ncbi:MAG: NADH-quinone oxidoreductase subunit J [Candidatus Bathyarchaeota archaeon]|nr:NADH-quinone oxidoreductase subunit J [Candidatus Bathyarchaeota archaeon]
MILELISIGLVISACLTIFLDEAVYSVLALTGTFLLTALLYALSGALFAAIFQFAMGVGTLAILFLSGEMLSKKPPKIPKERLLSLVAVGALLSLPMLFLSVSSPMNVFSDVQFEEALWRLRAGDVLLQGLVVLTVSVGIAIFLHEKKKGEE